MNQFKLWIHFSPAGFQGNQGLCVCATNLLPWTALSFSVPNQHMPSQTRQRGSQALLLWQPWSCSHLCSFPTGKSKSKEVSMTYCVCVCVKSWPWAELGKWMWHWELLWLLSPLDLSEPNNFITRASHQSKSILYILFLQLRRWFLLRTRQVMCL